MNKLFKLGLVVAAAVSLTACNIDFDGIGKDDEGNDITLLVLDIPACDVNYTFTVVDVVTGLPVSGSFTARITPDTANAGGLANPNELLVTDAMRVSLEHEFSGSLELLLNPNVAVSESNPVAFTAVAENLGNGYVGIPTYVRSTEKGKREIVLQVINTVSPPTQSRPNYVMQTRSVNPGSEISVNGAATLVGSLLNLSLGNGYLLQGLYRSSTSGTLTSSSSNPSAFDSHGILLISDHLNAPPRSSASLSAGQFFFLIKRMSNLVSGKLAFSVSSDFRASASFRYNVETSAGSFSGIFRSTIPFAKLYIEQLFAYSGDKSATLTLTPIADLNVVGSSERQISDITVSGGAIASPAYSVTKLANRTNYKIKLVGICASDRKVSIAPSKSFVYRKVGTEEWLRGELAAGQTSLLLETGADYEFGVNFDGRFYQYPFTTTRENIQNVLNNEYVEKYTLSDLSDGTFSISITVVAEEICQLTGND